MRPGFAEGLMGCQGHRPTASKENNLAVMNLARLRCSVRCRRTAVCRLAGEIRWIIWIVKISPCGFVGYNKLIHLLVPEKDTLFLLLLRNLPNRNRHVPGFRAVVKSVGSIRGRCEHPGRTTVLHEQNGRSRLPISRSAPSSHSTLREYAGSLAG